MNFNTFKAQLATLDLDGFSVVDMLGTPGYCIIWETGSAAIIGAYTYTEALDYLAQYA